jgi:hypothetical protein
MSEWVDPVYGNIGELFPQCSCSEAELRRRKQSNGVVIAGFQCVICGKCTRRVSVKDVSLDELPWWDEALNAAYWSERNQKMQRHFEECRARDDARWRSVYEQHLASEKWRVLRRKVMARCKGMCEGCGEKPAVQVHHLTYERLGDEMLFDLVGICIPCHERIHQARPSSGRAARATSETR